jgi:aminoglycoside phosphotransferase family enzyme/predicted kinase
MSAVAPIEPLPDGLVEALADPRAHPQDVSAAAGVARIQTHISHLFLTRDRVVKLRKATRPGFLDFGLRAQRIRDCLDEVALNRRLAPDVYLGIAPIEPTADGWRLGPPAEAPTDPDCEHAVVMRRLPSGTDALSRLAADALGPAELRAAAQRLASFHARHALGTPAPWTRDAWMERTDRPMRVCLATLRNTALVPEDAVAGLETAWGTWLGRNAAALEERRLAGCAVDGHGDVRLEHLWLDDPSGPVFIDCVEFDPELRRIDRASEVAFLAMDLLHRERPELAETFLAAYAGASDDFGLYALVDGYASYRAAVRASVAALAARDDSIADAQRELAGGTARRYFDLALALLRPPGPGRLVLMCGAAATGKSTVARDLALAVGGAVVLSTDRTRQLLATKGETAAERYAPERKEAVYDAVFERARAPLRAGRTVLLDGTFARSSVRERARSFARALGLDPWLVHVRCPEALARERAGKRLSEGKDPSEAGPEVVSAHFAAFEPPDEWPEARRLEVDGSKEEGRAAGTKAAAAELVAEGSS